MPIQPAKPRKRKPTLIVEMGDNPPRSARLRIAAPLELLEENPRGDLDGVMSVQLFMGPANKPNDYYVDVRFHGRFVEVRYPNGVAEETSE